MDQNSLLSQKRRIEGLLAGNLKESGYIKKSNHIDLIILDTCYMTRSALLAEHLEILKQMIDNDK